MIDRTAIIFLRIVAVLIVIALIIFTAFFLSLAMGIIPFRALL